MPARGRSSVRGALPGAGTGSCVEEGVRVGAVECDELVKQRRADGVPALVLAGRSVGEFPVSGVGGRPVGPALGQYGGAHRIQGTYQDGLVASRTTLDPSAVEVGKSGKPVATRRAGRAAGSPRRGAVDSIHAADVTWCGLPADLQRRRRAVTTAGARAGKAASVTGGPAGLEQGWPGHVPSELVREGELKWTRDSRAVLARFTEEVADPLDAYSKN